MAIKKTWSLELTTFFCIDIIFRSFDLIAPMIAGIKETAMIPIMIKEKCSFDDREITKEITCTTANCYPSRCTDQAVADKGFEITTTPHKQKVPMYG